MERSVELAGKSKSTLMNYARCLAHMAQHFNFNPIELDQEQVLDYLHLLKSQYKTPSESFFKHTVYGLRYACRLVGKTHLRISLPSIERPQKLPVVLSWEETKLLLKIPKLLKHRLILSLLYGCGLRCFELRKLKIRDADLDRKTIHIREGKGRKDRYVPLCDMLIRGIRKYLHAERPVNHLFNGKDKEGNPVGLSQRGIQWVVRQSKKQSGIDKDITAHTLRHSYATHLLEMGMDIMTVKDLLGHEHIQTTLTYLHVSQLGRQRPFSPLERLYEENK